MPNVKNRTLASIRLMPDLSVGADASNSVQFIAVVLGRTDDVTKLRNDICSTHNLKKIHMRRLIEKSKIAQTLSKLSTPLVHMYCFKVDRPRHAKTLESADKTQYMSATQRNQNIDFCIAMEIKTAISDSLGLFYQTWDNLVIEADQDTTKMFKAMGLTVTTEKEDSTVALPHYAYELADAVAWVNNAGSTLRGLRERDLIQKIDDRLHKKLRL